MALSVFTELTLMFTNFLFDFILLVKALALALSLWIRSRLVYHISLTNHVSVTINRVYTYFS